MFGGLHPESLTQNAANGIGLANKARHARPCAGHPRPCFAQAKKDVDGRDEPGHDEKVNRFQVVRRGLKMLDAFSVRLLGARKSISDLIPA
jgi:hypothetical protein